MQANAISPCRHDPSCACSQVVSSIRRTAATLRSSHGACNHRSSRCVGVADVLSEKATESQTHSSAHPSPSSPSRISSPSSPSSLLAIEEHAESRSVGLMHSVDDSTLRRLFATKRLFIAPCPYCTGVATKVVTALRHGIPVVSTTQARREEGRREWRVGKRGERGEGKGGLERSDARLGEPMRGLEGRERRGRAEGDEGGACVERPLKRTWSASGKIQCSTSRHLIIPQRAFLPY